MDFIISSNDVVSSSSLIMAVLTKHGHTALIRIPLGPSSKALTVGTRFISNHLDHWLDQCLHSPAHFVSPMIACFEAAYVPTPGNPTTPRVDEKFTITPRSRDRGPFNPCTTRVSWSRITLVAARRQCKVPLTLTLWIFSCTCKETSSKG